MSKNFSRNVKYQAACEIRNQACRQIRVPNDSQIDETIYYSINEMIYVHVCRIVLEAVKGRHS